MKKFPIATPVRLILATCLMSCAAGSSRSFIFPNIQGDKSRPIRVWHYTPNGLTDNSPVLFVMHGSFRNAKGSLNAWKSFADKYNFLLVAPEFSNRHYPKPLHYNLGGMLRRDEEGQWRIVEESKWAFSSIEYLFDHIKKMTGNKSERYYIYGHSAGGQFVHRFLLFQHDARIQKAVAANSGSYTMPDFKTEFPYGLKNSGMTQDTASFAVL